MCQPPMGVLDTRLYLGAEQQVISQDWNKEQQEGFLGAEPVWSL